MCSYLIYVWFTSFCFWMTTSSLLLRDPAKRPLLASMLSVQGWRMEIYCFAASIYMYELLRLWLIYILVIYNNSCREIRKSIEVLVLISCVT